MVDLKKKPFYLDEAAIAWVETTIAGMSEREKIGQLFVNMVKSRDPEDIREVVTTYHPGALRYPSVSGEEVWEQNAAFQSHSKVPLLIASNCEAGGNGGIKGGTPMACGAAVAAADSTEMAYQVGLLAAREATAVGCNWNFSPVVDILYNWRNTIVQNRAYNDSPEDTIRYANAFRKGVREGGMGDCAKHFPGDGMEENDQHLMMGLCDMDCETWDKTFGKVYQAQIDDGVMSIMIGHIAMPAYQRKLAGRELSDSEILPATLSKELVTDLLRDKLGFNGLVLTDASHMIGLWHPMERRLQVPTAIAAGCDMFLFSNDQEEDFNFMLEGYRSGIISEERLEDALRRILGMKAALGLHIKQAEGTLMPDKAGLSIIGCEEHKKAARSFADQFITLVKDTQKALPIDPKTQKRCKLVFIGGEGSVVGGKLTKGNSEEVKALLTKVLEEKGFEIYSDDMEIKGKMEDFRNNYDFVLVAMDVVGFAQYNSVRLKWAKPIDQPWYVRELPTVFVSFAGTNMLIDLTMSRTYINAYMDGEPQIRSFVDKLVGESPFKGRYNDNVWCGRWDTKL